MEDVQELLRRRGREVERIQTTEIQHMQRPSGRCVHILETKDQYGWGVGHGRWEQGKAERWVALASEGLGSQEGSLGSPGRFKVHVCRRMRFVLCWLPMAAV